jgi:hypothetical protein
MTIKELLFSAGICLSFSTAAQADLVPDSGAHQACLDRFEAVNHREAMQLRAQEVYIAPPPAAGQYVYFFNASERNTANPRQYRIHCEARKIGRVTRFEMEPGTWRFEAPDRRFAVR